MTFRRTLSLAALAVTVAFGAQAGTYKDKPHMPPYPGKSLPSVTSNSLTANNIAAGFGNKATQGVFADQSGGMGKWTGYPGVTSNSITANNIAAGVKNHANQDVMAKQSGSGGLTLNRLDALNLAAGEHNQADQRIFSQQR